MSPFRNADMCNDFGARYGIFEGIVMFEGEPKMVGHSIQLMGAQVRQCLAARLEAAQIGELDAGQGIQFHHRP